LSADFGQLRWQFFSPFRKIEKVWCNQGRLHLRESKETVYTICMFLQIHSRNFDVVNHK
jgi:hypothetical protein